MMLIFNMDLLHSDRINVGYMHDAVTDGPVNAETDASSINTKLPST